MGYVRDIIGLGTANRNSAIDNSLIYSTGTFTTGWRLWNVKEAVNLLNYNTGITTLNYLPFSISVNVQFWTSTARNDGGTNLTIFNQYGGIGTGTGTSTSLYYCPVRTFTVTGTTLT